MRSTLVPALVCILAASPLSAQYTQFGGGCNGGSTSTCISQNATATFVPYSTTANLPNEYAHAVINPVANGTVTVLGFRVLTDTVGSVPRTAGTAIYRDAAGAGSLTHTLPAVTQHGQGTIDVAGPVGWYTTYVYPAMIVGPGEAFWISVDTNGVNPPDARLGGTTNPPARSYWRRPPFTAVAWAVTGIVQDPIYEILCHGDTDVPVLSVDAPPAIGTTMNIRISNADPISPAAFLTYGLSTTSWNSLPLPLDMGLFGINGCNLLVSADLSVFALLNNGAGAVPFAIPNQAGLVGTTFHNQYAELRPTAPAGVAMTNAGTCVVQ